MTGALFVAIGLLALFVTKQRGLGVVFVFVGVLLMLP